jgi:ParB-like chromosome segregation protein Spo0J
MPRKQFKHGDNMTSGKFASFPLDQIIVNRDERQRREITDVSSLAQSISRVGLINPIVIEKSGVLRAGERRLTAIKMLGWTSVSVQFVEDMDEVELQILELEENTRRVDLPWQDQCNAISKYDALRKAQDPEWNMSRTGEALGLKLDEVSSKIQIAKEIESGNSKIIDAPRFTIARGIVRRDNERKRTSTLNEIGASVGETKKEAPIINEDFHIWQKSFSGTKFNFIHCDFPYGVHANTHAQGSAKSFGSYEDSFETYWNLINTLKLAMSNIVAESAHLMFWFSMDYYELTREALTDMGWEVNPFPLIWYKSDNMGILPDPTRGPRRIYETCFFASRGDRQIVRAVSNVVAAPTTKEIHMSEKPINMLKKFMEMFVDEYSVVLDPTCGSGNAVKAASVLGASTVLGLEIKKDFYELAKGAYYGNDDTDL